MGEQDKEAMLNALPEQKLVDLHCHDSLSKMFVC